MAEIIWTDPALSDLNDIAEYIAFKNPFAAKQLVKSIFTKVERLKTFPDSGRIPPEFNKPVYREVLVNPCRIFYRQLDENIYILFVMRSEQDLRRFLLDKM